MAEETLGYVELEWLCPHCSTRNGGTQKEGRDQHRRRAAGEPAGDRSAEVELGVWTMGLHVHTVMGW